MPPSLRRTYSTPVARSSPYTYPRNRAVNAPGGHRGISGSETSSRRVLADLEWWAVVDGQVNSDRDTENTDEEENRPALEHDLFQRSITPPPIGMNELFIEASPVHQMSALAITPRTPFRRARSPQSSAGSTPESHHRNRSRRLSVRDVPLADDEDEDTLLPLFTAALSTRPRSRRPLAVRRARTFSEFSNPFSRGLNQEEDEDDLFLGGFADFTTSPLSSHVPNLYN